MSQLQLSQVTTYTGPAGMIFSRADLELLVTLLVHVNTDDGLIMRERIRRWLQTYPPEPHYVGHEVTP